MLAGLLASLAIPPIGLWVMLFALSLPLVGALNKTADGGTVWQAMIMGGATGTGWLIFSLSWISNSLVTSGGAHMLLIPFSLIGLPLFLGLFWAAAFGISHGLARQLNLTKPMHLAVLIITLSLADYCRGFVLTGFPWNTMGLVLAANDLGLKLASVTGYWGGGLLILIASALPALIIIAGRMGASFALVIILAGLAAAHIPTAEFSHAATNKTVRILQPNIPQNDKWDYTKRRQHLTKMIAASRRDSDQPLDLIVWPESAFAGIYERERGVVSAVAQAASQGQTPVIMGTLNADEDPFRIYNSALLLNPYGAVEGRVSKRHLVPFGEYAPLRSFIPFVDVIAGPNDFSPGHGQQSLTFGGITALTLICYEVIFPSAVRDAQHADNADIMVVITNDAWFGNTIGPRQHLAMAQLRSAELGIPMIRSANTGISAMINSHGQITDMLDYDKSGTIDAVIGLSRRTIYGQMGDLIYVMMIVVFGAGVFCICLTRAKAKE